MTDRATLRAQVEALKTRVGLDAMSADFVFAWEAAIEAVLALLDAETGTLDSRGYVLPKFVSVVPIGGGGVQLEGHTKEQDWELELDAKGNVLSWSGAETGTAAPQAAIQQGRVPEGWPVSHATQTPEEKP